jgi:integrase
MNKTKYLQDPERHALTALLARHTTRDAILLQVLLHTGARACEALALRGADLNRHDKTVFIRGSKGSRDREIPLSKGLFKLVASLPCADDGRIFPISYQRLDQIWREWRPVTKKLHSLRHTFAIGLYKKSKDLKLVQSALGHKSITTTMIYADYIYSTEELRRALTG